jgi:hypothetical protein
MGWVVNATPRPLHPPGKRAGAHCIGCWVGLMADLDGCGKSRPPAVFDARTAQLNHPPPPSAEVKVVSYTSTPTHSAYIRTQFLLDGGTVPRSISPEPFFLPGTLEDLRCQNQYVPCSNTAIHKSHHSDYKFRLYF